MAGGSIERAVRVGTHRLGQRALFLLVNVLVAAVVMSLPFIATSASPLGGAQPVASAPVGAPFAMSTLGAGARSLRAPAMPSITGRPSTGSNTPGCVTGPATGCGLDQVKPPSNERDMSSKAWCPCDETVPTPKT